VTSSTDFSLWVSIGAWGNFRFGRDVRFMWLVDLDFIDPPGFAYGTPQTEVCAT
jgi:hypothetical protein